MPSTHLDKSEYVVEPVAATEARSLILAWHYSKSVSKQSTYTFGLYEVATRILCGVSWWLPPPKGSVDTWNPGGHKTTIGLHRLVIEPDRPTNAASFLIAANIRYIKRAARFNYLITYADTWQGHTGSIYKATNWQYRGMTRPYPIYVNSAGESAGTKVGNRSCLNRSEMAERGYTWLGNYPKHVYTFDLRQPKEVAA